MVDTLIVIAMASSILIGLPMMMIGAEYDSTTVIVIGGVISALGVLAFGLSGSTD